MRPAILDDLGLILALHAYCRNLAERQKLKFEIKVTRRVEALDADRKPCCTA